MSTGYGGAKIGTRIAQLVSTAIVSTHTRLIGVKHKLAMAVFSSISDVISEENHRATGPLIRKLHEGLDEDALSHALVEFMATEHGQLQAAAGISAASGSILASLAQVVNNELSPSVRGLLESNPHLIPDPSTVAQLVAKGLSSEDNGVQAIAQNGIDAGWADALIKSQEQYPDVGSMISLVRQGFIGRDTFMEWSVRNGVPVAISEVWVNLIEAPLSPADAALAVLRGNMTTQDGAAIAAKTGVSATDFNTIINNTGEPIALMQLLEAYRRDFIDEARLIDGIRQSRIRDEWTDVAIALRYSPMSVSDAVNAVVQNNLDQKTAQAYAQQNGLTPEHFPILVETAGEPLSRTEMEELFNRGEASQEQVLQALRESRLKNKYGELALKLHTRIIPVKDLADAVLYGTISHADAVTKAMQNGYSQQDATALITSASMRKMQADRDKIVASAEKLYEDGAISEEAASSIIEGMGYEASEVALKMRASEMRRQAATVGAAVNAVRAKYIGRHIIEEAAKSALDAIGLPSAERDFRLNLWTIERGANVRRLTPAQIVKAVGATLMTSEEGLAYLEDEGYSEQDATWLLEGA